jgi:hypothetical protein
MIRVSDTQEMGCIRPGLWMVEGYVVERVGSRKWVVIDRDPDRPDILLGEGATLADACVLIAEKD